MLTLSEDWSQVERLGDAIKAYKVASQRTLAFAIIKTGRELAYALHFQTEKITPSESYLKGLPQTLGWRIKRSSGTVAREIDRRIQARKFSAAGWKPAIKAFAIKGEVMSVSARLGIVEAYVDPSTGHAMIEMLNRAGPIEKVTLKHDLLEKAVTAVMENFAPYIKTKLGEEAEQAFRHMVALPSPDEDVKLAA